MIRKGRSVSELGKLLRGGKVSSRELVEQALRELKSLAHLRAFITLTENQALRQAEERDRELVSGLDRGPLHGIPMAHKDNYYTRGVRTTAGSLLYQNFVPSFDATVVKRLASAGAVMVGKTNLHELAFGITSKNPHYGFVANPHDPTRIPGGSSGGSAAAIAAGVLPLATGTDTGGSLRIPGSYCGIVGLKPTYGRISRYGIVPLSFSLDTAGPLGSCVEDCALAMDAMLGIDPADPTCAPVEINEYVEPRLPDLRKLRVGIPRRGFFERIDGQVESAVNAAISEMGRLGAQLSEVQTPDLNEMNAISRLVQLAETAALYHNREDSAQFGPDVWALIQQGKQIAAHEYVNAQRLRTLLRRDLDALWQKVDVLATPTTAVVAPRIAADTVEVAGSTEDVRLASTRLVRSFNLLGEPALSMPCGTSREGLPIGLQLITPPFTEPELLQIAGTLERELS